MLKSEGNLPLEQMLAAIIEDYRYCANLTGLPEPSVKTLRAISEVPREGFVFADQRRFAWENRPLPIGEGQTISQPFIVALMTDLLQPKETDTILEIGTGSGYQAAILSRLVRQVYSMEIIDRLASMARDRLHSLGYNNITVRAGDGRAGWPEFGPYDGIIVTAAADEVPPALIRQLKTGGRLIIPVRRMGCGEQLQVVEKDATGATFTREVLPVVFVPLTRGTGDHREGDAYGRE